MAHFRNKAGGPTRGRKRVRRIGMGSGRSVAKHKTSVKKGKRG